ncbi:zinc finger CCCH-type with G patch domain-containing protein [Aplochiton taeniatus]
MDEQSLEAAISAYGAQLQQVEVALLADLDSSQRSDLIQLKDDLTQLIELTEGSLVSVKKSQLLASLETGDIFQSHALDTVSTTTNGSAENEYSAFYSEVGPECSSDARERGNDLEDVGEEEEDGGVDEEDTLSGTKVRAPYRTSWGTLEYHNAMVVGPERPDGDEAQVRVLYVYPTQKSMKPCPFFLEDKCRFPDNCRFSHGEVVYVSELREFLESDISNLQEGSSCLARQEDGIWYPAKIEGIDGGFFTVKFGSALLKDAVMEADGIIPPLREDDQLSSDSELDDDDDAVGGENTAYARVYDPSSEASVQSVSSTFGGWETHTRGIGSKLMLKMGYEYGKGLGKTQGGRVEPVMAVVMPKGKSLDQCAELTRRQTQNKTAQDGTQVARKKRTRKPRSGATGGRQNVFDFLNRKLGATSTPAMVGATSGTSDAAPLPRATGVEAYQGGKGTKRSLNVKLFQAAERVSQTQREIQTLTESLSRRAGREAAVVSHLEKKLSAARTLLEQQKSQELSIQMEHRKADTHKKMTF